MKAKARRIGKLYLYADSPEERFAYSERWIKWANDLKMCDCWMCARLRKTNGPRPQEYKALAYWRQDLQEWQELAAKQEPLGEDFARVLYDNLWDLYEEDLPMM